MRNSELIEKLKQFDPDTEVIFLNENGNNEEIIDVKIEQGLIEIS